MTFLVPDSEQDQSITAYITDIEHYADQAASDGYYGLQDVCLLLVEALHALSPTELTQTSADLLPLLARLPEHISAYYQGLATAVTSIVNLLHQPALSFELTDDEFAELEAMLISGMVAPVETAPITAPTLSRETRELVDLLIMEADVIQGFLSTMVIGDAASVLHGLEQITDELDRYTNVSTIADFHELVLICEHVNDNINGFSQYIDSFNVAQLNVLSDWLTHLKDYLTHFSKPDAGQALLVHLTDNAWVMPLTLDSATDILTAMRSHATRVSNQQDEPTRKQLADSDDVSLTLPDDVNHELLDILLQELPVQTLQFSQALQHMHSGGQLAALDVAQRVAHTIKGSANTVGIKGIAVLTHHLEDILVACARENSLPNAVLMAVLLDAADCLEAMSEALMGFAEPPPEALAVLQNVLDWANRIEQSGLEAATLSAPVSAEDAPLADDLTRDNDDTVPTLAAAAMVRVPSEHIETLFRQAGESIIVNGQANERLRRLKVQLQAMDDQFTLLRQLGDDLEQLIDLKDLSGRLAGAMGAEFDALEMDQYNELHTASRRMVEAAVDAREMNRDARKELELMAEALDDQQQLALDSQNAVMQMRLVPVSSIVPRLQRALRQTCRLTHKHSDLVISGEHLLIDGDTLNDLVDPLLHLLRNAVDHGIETEAERLAQGKAAHGNISISFDREGNNIVVRCRDDGRGLDFNAIRAAAERRGVIQPNQIVSEDELKRLILRPNFSTRSQSTQTSGRGVGMDAVHFQVINKGGTLALQSQFGQGLIVELRLPLPLSRSHALLATAGHYRVAIASKGLLQILYSGAGDLTTVDDRQVLQLGQHRYPTVTLNKLLNVPEQTRAAGQHGVVLLVQNDADITAVLLDAVTDSLDIVIKNLGPYIKKIPGFMGGAIMGDSSVLPVLDIPELLRTAMVAQHHDFEPVTVDESYSPLPTVLVVDDSLSQRRALEQMLQDTGFAVQVARDGIEAAELLAHFKPDIILTDLEMPRMNGIELTAHIRARAGIKTVPVIMITSRTTQKHRKMADDAGVNVYLVKPVREDDLLEKIQSLIDGTVSALTV